MIEVGIPVYKARETLPQALDSLVVQTKKNFIVCLSIDGDGEDYSDIINTYRDRGLKIRVIENLENRGPGVTRQTIIDSTMCDYITFLDADDLFNPRAIEVLYNYAKLQNVDILEASFIKEEQSMEDRIFSSSENIITWMHGKAYKVDYLKEKNIRFLPDIRLNEDSYFNMVAWNSTKNKATTDEVLYVWRHYKGSLTRKDDGKEYFSYSYLSYIDGQVRALKKLYELNQTYSAALVSNCLINLYHYYMKARYYKLDENCMDDSLCTLREEPWINDWYNNKESWTTVLNNLHPGQVCDNNIIFYDEIFIEWVQRTIYKE